MNPRILAVVLMVYFSSGWLCCQAAIAADAAATQIGVSGDDPTFANGKFRFSMILKSDTDSGEPIDFTHASVDVALITNHEKGTPTRFGPDIKIDLSGGILVDIPDAEISELKQDIVVKVRPGRNFPYFGDLDVKLDRSLIPTIHLPLIVPLQIIREKELRLHLVSKKDGSPVADEPVICQREGELGRVAPLNIQKSGKSGEVVYTIDDDGSYIIASPRVSGDQGAFTHVILSASDIRVLKGPIEILIPAPVVTVHFLIGDGSKPPIPVGDIDGNGGLRWEVPGHEVLVSAPIEHGVLKAFNLTLPGVYSVLLPPNPPFSYFVIVSGGDVNVPNPVTAVSQDVILKRKGEGNVTLTLLDAESGNPIIDAKVTLTLKGSTSVVIRSDKIGKASTEKIPEGNYSVAIEGAGVRPISIEVTVVGNIAKEIKLKPTRTLQVKVVDQQDHVVQKSRVVLFFRNNDRQNDEANVIPGADGVGVVRGVPDGDADLLVADAQGTVVFAERIKITADSKPTVHIRPGIEIQGTIPQRPGITFDSLVFVRHDLKMYGGTTSLSPKGIWNTKVIPGEYDVYATVKAPIAGYILLQTISISDSDRSNPIDLQLPPLLSPKSQEEVFGLKGTASQPTNRRSE